MIICNCIVHMDLYDIHSLKGRRSIINKVKERLKQFNVSVLDVSDSYVKEADIAFVFISHDAREAAKYRKKLEDVIVQTIPEYAVELEFEAF